MTFPGNGNEEGLFDHVLSFYSITLSFSPPWGNGSERLLLPMVQRGDNHPRSDVNIKKGKLF